MSLPMFVYGSLRSGGGMDLLLPGPRKSVILPGWTLYEYGPIGAEPWYPVMIRGAAAGAPPVSGELVFVDWDDPDVRKVVEVECGAGYVPAIVPITTVMAGVSVRLSALAWEWVYPDSDRIGPAIPSGDWLTHMTLRSLR